MILLGTAIRIGELEAPMICLSMGRELTFPCRPAPCAVGSKQATNSLKVVYFKNSGGSKGPGLREIALLVNVG